MAAEVLFEIKTNDKVGRYAVASTNLGPGQEIITETPFAFGPKPDQPPMCLGCYLPVDCTYLCSSCKWPVCGPECETIAAHKNAECAAFSKAGVQFQPVADPSEICLQYECVTPLRVLLASEVDRTRWEKDVKHMETHNDKRKELPIWVFNQVNIVEYLRGPCKLDRFSEDLIHSVCGMLEVNTFEAYPPNGGYSIRCLYPKIAVLSHSCVSNINHSIYTDADSSFKVTVRASIAVKAGEELFSSYVYPLWPTLVRRSFLKQSKYFECDCKRCSDPTELGTHMGTIKCSKCDNGVVISTAPLNFDATWKCTHCPFTTNATAILKVYRAIQADVDNVDAGVGDASEGIEARESLYRKYRSVLHPRNTYHTILRISLAQMYGKVEGYSLEELPDLLLERKLELCQQILENLDVLEPGYTRTRGMIIYEMHAPIILLARNLYRNGCIDKKDLRRKLEEAIKLLENATKILSLQPKDSPEGLVGQGAALALQQLKTNIDELVDADL